MSAEEATVVCADLANNALGRAHLLALLLQPRYEVRIVGPAFGPVWAPLRSDPRVPIVAVPAPRWGLGAGRDAWRRVADDVRGSLVYVGKPFATSLWAASRHRRRSGAKVLVDIDDDETAFLRSALARRSLAGKARYLLRLRSADPREAWNTLGGQLLARRGDDRTVSNSALQKRYGGTIIWHARDPDEFDPKRWSRDEACRHWGLPSDRRNVLFLGTPRRHKGIEQLVDAVAGLPRDVHLVLAGFDQDDYAAQATKHARDRLADRVTVLPTLPFADAPRLLAAADLFVVPQQDTPVARGQMPAKVFDAMAMAIPTVATALSDLPEVLAGCGRVVPPGDAAALQAAMRDILDDPAAARRMGATARERFLHNYSIPAVRRTLDTVLDRMGV